MKTTSIDHSSKARKRPGGERGSAKDRRARKRWILGHFGDGERALCVHCAAIVDFETMEVDRTEIGGKYVRANVQPSCQPCNRDRADDRGWVGSNPQPHPDRPIYGPGSYGHWGEGLQATCQRLALAA